MQFFLVYSSFNTWPSSPCRVAKVFPSFEEAEKHAVVLGQDKDRASVWIEKLEISKTDLLFLLVQYNVEVLSSILDEAKDKFKIEKIEVK